MTEMVHEVAICFSMLTMTIPYRVEVRPEFWCLHGGAVIRKGKVVSTRSVTPLREGDVLTVVSGGGAYVWASGMRGRYLIPGPSRSIWTHGAVHHLSGVRSTFKKDDARLVKFEDAAQDDVIGGYNLRGPEPSGFRLTPSGGYLSMPAKAEWKSTVDSSEFRLAIFDSNQKPVVDASLPGTATSFDLPKTLVPGKTYRLKLLAISDPSGGAVVTPVERDFRVCTSVERSLIQKLVADISSDEKNVGHGLTELLKAQVYEHYRMYSDASEALRETSPTWVPGQKDERDKLASLASGGQN